MTKYNSPFRGKCHKTTAFKVRGNWRAGYHTGEDWVADGNRTLVSPANGTVSYIGWDKSGYGNYLILHTDDKRCILMAHMADKPCVKVGQRLRAGDKVGVEGTTGNSTGLHLHIEVQSVPDWNYARNLLCPSDYINFTKKDDDTMGVRQLCAILRYKGIYKGTDAEIIKAAQRRAKCTVDGIAGEKTVAQMYKDIHDFDTALQKRINKAKSAAKEI